MYDLDVTFDGKVSRRGFLKFLAAGATTLAFGSVLGFSSFFAVNKNGRSGIGSGGGGIGGGGIQQVLLSLHREPLSLVQILEKFQSTQPT